MLLTLPNNDRCIPPAAPADVIVIAIVVVVFPFASFSINVSMPRSLGFEFDVDCALRLPLLALLVPLALLIRPPTPFTPGPPSFAYSLGGVWDNPKARATVDDESARARARMAESPPALEVEEYDDTESAREIPPPTPMGRGTAFLAPPLLAALFRSPTSLLLDRDRNETEPNWICRLPVFVAASFSAWTIDSRTSYALFSSLPFLVVLSFGPSSS